MTNITIHIFHSQVELSKYAADWLPGVVQSAVRERGRFTAALSGGGTPMAFYRRLAENPYRETLPWENMFFFWGDERCVPVYDPENSYNQARQAFLEKAGVKAANIIRVQGELGPEAAAEDYTARLLDFAEDGLRWPRFDLALMGLGGDGHTASLFPGSALTEGVACIPVTAHYQDRPANRVSLTPDVFNSARTVVFMATGEEKAAAVQATVTGLRDLVRLPAQRIMPRDGDLHWLVDEAAAARLPTDIPTARIERLS